MAIKVRVAALSKQFDGKAVLQDVTFDVPAGRKSVIVGPAASGKTVLMKCIAGIFRPTTGTVEIDGHRVTKAGSRDHVALMQSVGVLFQQGGLFDGLPVWKNVSFKLVQTRGVSDADAKRIAIEKLEMVNLPSRAADLFPAELSGGMQKRVGIARALAGDPTLLLLDEPTAGLDPITTTAINALIDHSIKEIGATVLSITSDMDSARTAYQEVFMLHEGRLVWSGSTGEIDRTDNPYILQMINGRAVGPIEVLGRSEK